MPRPFALRVVLNSQIFQIRILEFRFLQIRQLAVVGDPCTSFNKAVFASRLSLVHPGGLHSSLPKSPSESSFHKRVKTEELH